MAKCRAEKLVPLAARLIETPRVIAQKRAGAVLDAAHAAGVPDFASLDAHLVETQARVRECFERLLDDRN